ncbi:MAG: MBL fold metallo-hydrolase [Patescibacteria group bacterium]
MTKKFHLIVLGILCAATVAVWTVLLRAERGALTVAFLDVGQGDSIFIETSRGAQALIDGGADAHVLSALGSVMPWYDRSLDLVLATHPDKDHVGGLAAVIDRYDVSSVVWNGAGHDTKTYQNFLDAAKEEEASGARFLVARRGQRFALDTDVFLDILFPDRDPNGWETNDGSIVAMLTFGDEKFLLTGDAPKGVETYLVGLDGEKLRANVLKLGHHGSKTSSALEFLSAVAPEYAVVSAGENNQYGHPHEEALSAARNAGAAILSTIDSKTVIFMSDSISTKLMQ